MTKSKKASSSASFEVGAAVKWAAGKGFSTGVVVDVYDQDVEFTSQSRSLVYRVDGRDVEMQPLTDAGLGLPFSSFSPTSHYIAQRAGAGRLRPRPLVRRVPLLLARSLPADDPSARPGLPPVLSMLPSVSLAEPSHPSVF